MTPHEILHTALGPAMTPERADRLLEAKEMCLDGHLVDRELKVG